MQLHTRKEGGWEAIFRIGDRFLLRYIIPDDAGQFAVINPYKVEHTYPAFPTFLAACRYIKKTVAM